MFHLKRYASLGLVAALATLENGSVATQLEPKTAAPLHARGHDGKPSAVKCKGDSIVFYLGSPFGRPTELRFEPSKTDRNKLIVRGVFESGRQFELALERMDNGRFKAQTLPAGAEAKGLEFDCTSAELAFKDLEGAVPEGR
jgi:hypothetical protein